LRNFKEGSEEEYTNAPEAPLVSEVLMHLQLDYVNPDKLDPEILLKGALTELERIVPELWVSLQLFENTKPSSLRILIGEEMTVLPISKLREIYDLQSALTKLMKYLLEKNIQLTQFQIEQLFVRGILNQLDEYSVLLPNEIYREFNINIGGQFAGVGLVVGLREGHLTVIAPMDGSPAGRAGIQPLDRIVAVDGEKTEHLTLEEILHRLRGDRGTPVNLSVFREGNTKALNFVLIREEIKVESIETHDLESRNKTFRYIQIKNFQKNTSRELKNKIKDLEGVSGLILDLRNNPGGLLEEAVRISDLFLPGKQRIVSTKGPSVLSFHNSKKLFSGENFEEIPLVVLINRGSASASEIVAASLKQSGRAIVIGEQSFGKGTVQTLWDLYDGSGLKLTVGEYMTPSGHSIHNIGVKPTIILMPIYIPENVSNIQLILGHEKEYTEQLRFKLINKKQFKNAIKDTDTYRISYVLNQLKHIDGSEIIDKNTKIRKLKGDIFVGSAIHSLHYRFPEKINSNLREIFSELELSESKKIIKKLAELDIDWSLNPFIKKTYPENLDIRIESENISADILNLKVQIKNVGEIAAQRLIAVTGSSNVLLDGIEFPIGKLHPGQEFSRSINVKFAPGMMEEVEPVEIVLYDQNMEKLKKMYFNLNFAPRRNPSFMVSTKIFDDGTLGSKGNGDGKIQLGETIALSFKLINLGENVVPELLLKIKGIDGIFRINRGKIILKQLIPDVEKNDYFLFQSLGSFKKMGKISLEIIDTKSGNPKIFRMWDLNKNFTEQKEVTPNFNLLNLTDSDGNILKGETSSDSIILTGKIKNADNLRDIFVHLNDKKIFYSEKINDYNLSKKHFRFSTKINLVPGKNQISVFARNNLGTTSERRIRILKKQLRM